MKPLVLLLSLCMAMSACSIQEKADRLSKTSDEINDNSRELKDNSEEINSNSEELLERTEDLETELTFKESYAELTSNLDRLFGADRAAQPLSEKITGTGEASLSREADQLVFAGASIMSMLSQYWGPEDEKQKDSDEIEFAVLDRRMALSAEVIFARITKHIPRTFKVDVLLTNESYTGVAALGAKLDEVRPEFLRNLKKAGLPAFSFYDVVIEALGNRRAKIRSERLPKTVSMVLQWKQEAIYMLQLRHNLLPLMVVARMTDLQDRSMVGKAEMAMMKQSVDLSKFDYEQLKIWSAWLKKAKDTREQLAKIGIMPELNSGMMAIVRNIDFGDGTKSLDAVEAEFVSTFDSIR